MDTNHSQDDIERSKAALAHFANVVSHDLSAPLRHARYFSSALVDSIDENLDENQIELNAQMEQAFNKMESMLEVMLRYSRLTSDFRPSDDIRLNDIIERLPERYSSNTDDSILQIVPLQLPIFFTCDEKQINTVFDELIDNSRKFRHPDRDLKIHVSIAGDDDRITLSISDNGIGIDETELEYALLIFRQLEPTTEGSGAGLAMVQRITGNHGGTLDFEQSELGGLLVTITLPR